MAFKAVASSGDAPVLDCHWDFGDGTSLDGMEVRHAFTHSGDYVVQATATGLDGATNRKTLAVAITGEVPTRFEQGDKQRPE